MAGDNYTQGQGFQGPDMKVKSNTITFQQIWNQTNQGVDFDAVTSEIDMVRQQIKHLPESEENDIAVGVLAKAKEAAMDKDGPTLLERLKGAPVVILEVAKDVAAMTLAELVKSVIGIA